MIQLKNEKLQVKIEELGAEIKAVYHLEHQVDYMWKADPNFWGRTAPVLFPIVGRVVEDTYYHNNQPYHLSQHGFARDMTFELVSHTDTAAWFELTSNEETLVKYPFAFVLRIGYELEGETVKVKWEVKNKSEEVLPFSIGAHPAFNIEGDMSDYYLHLEHNEGVETLLFNSETGLLSEEKEVIIEKLKLLPLGQGLFEEYPTVVLEGETGLTLRTYTHDREVRLGFEGFPYVGIWSPLNQQGEVAPFICIEPWFGLADTVIKPQDIMQKKGIQKLEANGIFNATYTMTFN